MCINSFILPSCHGMLALPPWRLWYKQGLWNLCELPNPRAWWVVRLEFELRMCLPEQIYIYTGPSQLNSRTEPGSGPARSWWPCAYVCVTADHILKQVYKMKESNYKIPDRVHCEIINPIAFIFRKICSWNMSIIMGVIFFIMCTNSSRGINLSQSRHAKSAFRLLCTVSNFFGKPIRNLPKHAFSAAWRNRWS